MNRKVEVVSVGSNVRQVRSEMASVQDSRWAGSSMPMRIPIIAMTTNSSTSVKAFLYFFIVNAQICGVKNRDKIGGTVSDCSF